MIPKCIFIFENIKAQKFQSQEISNCSKQLLTVRAGLGVQRIVELLKKIMYIICTTSPGFSSLV